MKTLLIGLFVLPLASFAKLPEKALYARCYFHLTGRPVPRTSVNFLLIKKGEKKAIDACAELLEKPRLNPNGDLEMNDPEAKWVLNTFYEFHRTWFPTSRITDISGFRAEFEGLTESTMEFSSPALALTYHLAARNPYQSVLRGSEDFYAVRETGGDTTGILTTVAGYSAEAAVINLSVPGVAMNAGSLLGIRKRQLLAPLENYEIPSVGLPAAAGGAQPANLFQHFGGGILGQQAFFALNSGHPKGLPFDGALKLPRKWGKTIMESLMCLHLPNLREADIQRFQVPASNVPFRRSQSCITCHASMDQIAMTARNLFVGATTQDGKQRSLFVGHYVTRLPASDSWPSEGSSQFKHQPPLGRLMYRSFHNGTLMDVPVQNLEDLGQKISETTEFYQCAAKKYFEYFTGISVSLYDRTNPLNAELNRRLTPRDIHDRLFVEALAASLKKSQSLSQLVLEIMKSPYYRSSTYDPEGNP